MAEVETDFRWIDYFDTEADGDDRMVQESRYCIQKAKSFSEQGRGRMGNLVMRVNERNENIQD